MTADAQRKEFLDLVDAFCRDDLTAAEQARFRELIAGDEELRADYVQYVHMHVCLRRAFNQADDNGQVGSNSDPAGLLEATAEPASSAAEVSAERSRRPRTWQRRALLWISIATAAALLAAVGWRYLPSFDDADAAQVSVATLTGASGCLWGGEPLEENQSLAAGQLALDAGIAEVTLNSGVRLVLEAPVNLKLLSPQKVRLNSGRVVARVPKQAIGFSLQTTKANVVDLGTEFGVGVDRWGETTVQVFDGSVIAEWNAPRESSRQKLVAGQAMKIAEAAEEIPFAKERFIRRLPLPEDRGKQWVMPYNESHYDAVHIVPAPGQVKIDGQLDDWDRSGGFTAACAEPFAKHYRFTGHMMYDDEHLYIAAHVRDPAPLCSTIDPRVDPSAGWKGGSVQVRLSTDPALGWPLAGESSLVGKHGQRPEDLSDNLVHVTMWHYAPRQEPCLYLRYGMDMHGEKVNPQGYRGAYQPDADSRGYTMEYAIRWELLHAQKRPPRGRDTLGAIWLVHWSDEGGRIWRGHVIEVTNPGSRGLTGMTHMRAAFWGKAIYHPDGNLPPGTVKRIPSRGETYQDPALRGH